MPIYRGVGPAGVGTSPDAAGVMAVRGSKNPDGPVLLLTRAALRTAVRSAVKAH